MGAWLQRCPAEVVGAGPATAGWLSCWCHTLPVGRSLLPGAASQLRQGVAVTVSKVLMGGTVCNLQAWVPCAPSRPCRLNGGGGGAQLPAGTLPAGSRRRRTPDPSPDVAWMHPAPLQKRARLQSGSTAMTQQPLQQRPPPEPDELHDRAAWQPSAPVPWGDMWGVASDRSLERISASSRSDSCMASCALGHDFGPCDAACGQAAEGLACAGRLQHRSRIMHLRMLLYRSTRVDRGIACKQCAVILLIEAMNG